MTNPNLDAAYKHTYGINSPERPAPTIYNRLAFRIHTLAMLIADRGEGSEGNGWRFAGYEEEWNRNDSKDLAKLTLIFTKLTDGLMTEAEAEAALGKIA